MEENYTSKGPEIRASITSFTGKRERDLSGNTRPGSSIKTKKSNKVLIEDLVNRFSGLDIVAVPYVKAKGVSVEDQQKLDTAVEHRLTQYAKEIREEKRRSEDKGRA